MVADVPALRLGAWRLQITTALCSPVCVWQFLRLQAGKQPSRSCVLYSAAEASAEYQLWLNTVHMRWPRSADLKRRTLRSCGRLAFSGICLAIHFSSWVWGIKV
jgi:hypothetical protein